MRLCTTIPVTLRRCATGKLKQWLLNLSLLAQEALIVVWLLIHTSFAFKEICNYRVTISVCCNDSLVCSHLRRRTDE